MERYAISEANFLIFRDGRRQVSATELTAKLRDELLFIPERPGIEKLVSLLLRAGELECALRDAGSDNADRAAQITDLIAQRAVEQEHGASARTQDFLQHARRILAGITGNRRVSVSTPEGFAYYALHPLDYADLAEQFHATSKPACRSVFIVGIRSIGTTLSAVVAAKLQSLGFAAGRTTVRPTGHPYQRKCTFDIRQRELVRLALACGDEFILCDEGPGRSGSSFLSVAEALEREGVPAARITLFCSYEPDIESLCADHAATRWGRYRSMASGLTRRLPAEAGLYVGGGAWRNELLKPGEERPSSWTAMERLKYLTRDRRHLLKFEGHGQYGEPVRLRNEALAEAGFGAPYTESSRGFGCHLMLAGKMGTVADISAELLARMARYCWWRSREVATSHADVSSLREMLETNYQIELERLPIVHLLVERPLVADGRMQPHEWFCTSNQTWLKLDSATHGDDHFFPGPCDVAWDLAGAIVEWELNSAARDFFLSEYQKCSGDDAALRVKAYEMAYATFRYAWTRMAAAAVRGTEDEHLLMHDYQRYRRAAQAAAAGCERSLRQAV